MSKLYSCEDFKPGEAVVYLPSHAAGDLTHPDVEFGAVSSHNVKFVFVKYFPRLTRLGWENCTSQATDPFDLIKAVDLEGPKK